MIVAYYNYKKPGTVTIEAGGEGYGLSWREARALALDLNDAADIAEGLELATSEA